MTHKDIYTKFLIEYDKADVTSSYPSLTEYEVATLLDKAYLALIAQKATGNNPRRAMFEADNKAIADIAPLITHKELELFTDGHEPAVNIIQYKLPKDFLYYVSSALNQKMIPTNPNGDRLLEPEVYAPADIKFEAEDDDSWVKHSDVYYGVDSSFDTTSDSTKTTEAVKKGLPYDGDLFRLVPMKITTHLIAEKFFNTPYNMPWVKIPVTYAEGDSMFVVYDPINKPMLNSTAHLSYIRKPLGFVSSLKETTLDNPTDNPEPTIDNPEQPTDAVFKLDISRLNGGDTLGADIQNGSHNDDSLNGSGNNTENTTPVDSNPGGESNNLNDTEVIVKSYVFSFDNPESLNPSITRSPYEGGGVECENIQFTSSDEKVSITFDNSNVTPKSNARIVTNNEANLKIPYLTVDRGHIISIHVDGENAKLRYVRIPAGDIIGGITFDHTYPTETVGTFSLTQDNKYYSWDNTEPLQNITTLYLKNNSPVPPMVHLIEVGYTTADATLYQEPSLQELPTDNPSTNTELGPENIEGMTADFLLQDENGLLRSVYLSKKMSDGSVTNAADLNDYFAFFVTRGTPIYTSDKQVQLREYYNNNVVATGKIVSTTLSADAYGDGDKPLYAIKVQFDNAITNGSLSPKRYVMVIFRGTFGDSNFSQYMQNPSQYLQSGKSKSDCHTNEYMYYFVDLV